MRNRILQDSLEELIDLLKEARNAEPRVAAAAAQFACVSANGHVEEYLKNSMVDFYRNRCDDNALRIVKRSIDSYYNFKQDRVVKFINDLRPDRNDTIGQCFEVRDKLADALGSIVGNKNTVGHTGTSSVTPTRVIGWLEELIDSLDEMHRAAF